MFHAAIELGQNTAAIGLVIDIPQHVKSLDDLAELFDRPCEARLTVIGV